MPRTGCTCRRFAPGRARLRGPGVPVDQLVDRPTALRGAARLRAPPGIGTRVADADAGDEGELLRDSEEVPQLLLVVIEDPVDGRRETLLDRGEQDEHHRGAGIDVPERHGPLDLFAFLELVFSLVAVVVVALARHDEDLGSGGLEPPLDALERFVAPERRDLREELRIVDDEQALPCENPALGARRTVATIRSSASRGTGSPE